MSNEAAERLRITTASGQDLLDYIDGLADLAGDGERALAFTKAWRAIRARLPFIEREAHERSAGAAPLEQLLELAERYHSGHSVAGSPCTCDLCRELRVVRRYAEGTDR